MQVELWASSRVLKQGEVLTVNCTTNYDIVFFTWTFPRKQVSVNPTKSQLQMVTLVT